MRKINEEIIMDPENSKKDYVEELIEKKNNGEELDTIEQKVLDEYYNKESKNKLKKNKTKKKVEVNQKVKITLKEFANTYCNENNIKSILNHFNITFKCLENNSIACKCLECRREESLIFNKDTKELVCSNCNHSINLFKYISKVIDKNIYKVMKEVFEVLNLNIDEFEITDTYYIENKTNSLWMGGMSLAMSLAKTKNKDKEKELNKIINELEDIGNNYHYKMAYTWLGKICVEKNDYKNAEKYYKLGASLGSNIAMVDLGEIYLNGDLGKKDYANAYLYLSQASITKDHTDPIIEGMPTRALILLSKMYYYGYYVDKNVEFAKDILRRFYIIAPLSKYVIETINSYDLSNLEDIAYYNSIYEEEDEAALQHLLLLKALLNQEKSMYGNNYPIEEERLKYANERINKIMEKLKMKPYDKPVFDLIDLKLFNTISKHLGDIKLTYIEKKDSTLRLSIETTKKFMLMKVKKAYCYILNSATFEIENVDNFKFDGSLIKVEIKGK